MIFTIQTDDEVAGIDITEVLQVAGITSVILSKHSRSECRLCNGVGYYTAYTDRGGEDGGEYAVNYACSCTKSKKEVL